MTNIKILVLSKSYEAALGISRSLKIDGYTDIDLYFIGNATYIKQSNVFQRRTFYNDRDDDYIIKNLIQLYGNASKKVILFPGDDYTTSLADRYRPQLEELFIYTYVDGHKNGAITKLMDKEYQTELANNVGLPMAQSWEVHFVNGRYEIPSELIYPCFVKPLVSANGAAKSVIGKCEDADKLKSYLSRKAEQGITFPLIIQEYISIEDEFNIHGICDGDNFILPIIHKKLATANHNKGVTVLGKNLDPRLLAPHLCKLEKLLKSTNYHGVFNVEMFISKSVVYLNEINFRIAGTCWGATGAGVNIPSMWVKTLLGEFGTWDKITPKYDTVFINDKTAFEDFTLGYCGPMKFLKWQFLAQYHLIKSDFDPNPYKKFRRDKFFGYLKHPKRIIRGLLHIC